MKKILYLDGLRGIASLIVVLNHFAVAFYPALYTANYNEIHTKGAIEVSIANSPLNLLYNGNFAVCIFFVLSGYVLTYKFFKYKDLNIITSSAVRRYFRLSLPVFATTFIIYLFMKMHLLFNVEAGEISYSTWWLSTFWNFGANIWEVLKYSFFHVFANSNGKYNGVLWTMSYEFYGSFLVFSIAAIFYKLRKRFFIYIILVLITFKTYYLAFILGLILADFINCKENYIVLFNNKLINTLLIIIGLFLGSYPTGVNVDGTIYEFMIINFKQSFMIYHIIGAFFIILALINSKYLQDLFSKKAFIFLGNISFSLYLIHLVIIGSFSCWFFMYLLTYTTYSIAVIATCSVSLIIIFIISFIIFKYVDTPSVKVSKILYDRFLK